MLLFLSDFDTLGSGYMQIAMNCCYELARRGHRVMAIGWGYDGSEHNHPFSILPVAHSEAFAVTPAILHNLGALAAGGQLPPIEAILVALDIPLQERVLSLPRQWPYIAIFPVESGPLCRSWASSLSLADERLVISQWGQQQCADAGLLATHLPVGIDAAVWRRPEADEREAIRRALGYQPGTFAVLTVADNQERKNLWAAGEAVALLKRRLRVPIRWTLVTRARSAVGYKLEDMASVLGIADQMSIVERGVPFARLWALYASSDAFLLTSKAEGLCMPVVEAMACGVPVVATDCAAVTEHLWEDWRNRKGPRGFPIATAYRFVDPWGNSYRHLADPASAAEQLERVCRMRGSGKLNAIVARARQYAESRTVTAMGETLSAAVERAKASAARSPAAPEGG